MWQRGTSDEISLHGHPIVTDRSSGSDATAMSSVDRTSYDTAGGIAGVPRPSWEIRPSAHGSSIGGPIAELPEVGNLGIRIGRLSFAVPPEYGNQGIRIGRLSFAVLPEDGNPGIRLAGYPLRCFQRMGTEESGLENFPLQIG